ncbi:Nramp family divalent metal transporter [candidate division KSB1 bacterium]|nr:Nramp family divalent metal transporter [candidate division KSB1 bacterium]
MENKHHIKSPPAGLAVLALVGPSFIWAAEFIGSGEVILSTRVGALLGPTVLWAIVVGVLLKFWIGMSGARYTVCTGEGMIDMISRIPGPKNWGVWITLVAQFAAATISIGSLATAAGIFVHSLVGISPLLSGWLVTIFALAVVWTNLFNVLKIVMSFFVLVVVLGVLYVAAKVFPDVATFFSGLLFDVPEVPDWALSMPGVQANPWREILPLIGWAAGGFASQVWYTYWVIGANYGAAAGRGYGRPADENMLRTMSAALANKIKVWCHVVYADAVLAMIIGVVTTGGFLLAGAGVLRPHELAPEGATVATTLATIFSERWGNFGGMLFLFAGACALIGTQVGQLAGWPRLLADTFRICFPRFEKLEWKWQFRLFLGFFFFTNMIFVYTFGLKPVIMVKLSAILDGLLLTPFQALWVLLGLYVVMPKMLSPEAAQVLKPSWIFAAGLIVAFSVFGYFCIFQMPFVW